MTAVLSAARLVISRPMYAGNLGAVARVAANFDLRDVWLVAPDCDPLSREALLYAKGPARAYLERMKRVASLDEALSGARAAVGFTRRQGALRQPSIELPGISKLLSGPGPVALVFGREDTGLEEAELLRCTHVCSLPVAQVMPSLNLSHAVAVVVARLFSERSQKGPEAQAESGKGPAVVDELEALITHWRQAMIDAGMTTAGNPDRMLAHMRRALQRAALTERDIRIFRGYLSKTQVAMGSRRRSAKTD